MKNSIIVIMLMLLVACDELVDSTDTFSIAADGGAAVSHNEGLTDPLMVAAQDTGTGAVTIWFMQGLNLNTTTFSQTLIMTIDANGATGSFTDVATPTIVAVYGQDVNASTGGGTYFAINPLGTNEIVLNTNEAVGGLVSGSYSLELCSYDPATPATPPDCVGGTKTVAGSFSVAVENTSAPTGLGL